MDHVWCKVKLSIAQHIKFIIDHGLCGLKCHQIFNTCLLDSCICKCSVSTSSLKPQVSATCGHIGDCYFKNPWIPLFEVATVKQNCFITFNFMKFRWSEIFVSNSKQRFNRFKMQNNQIPTAEQELNDSRWTFDTISPSFSHSLPMASHCYHMFVYECQNTKQTKDFVAVFV